MTIQFIEFIADNNVGENDQGVSTDWRGPEKTS